MSRAMFGNPKDDPWANKDDDDDDWDTDPDFENKETIKQGSKKEEIVSAAEAQRRLRGELDEERSKKFGVPTPVSVDRGNYEEPAAPTRTQPTKTWNPQQELAGKPSVSAAKNAFSQPAYQEPERPAPRQVAKPAPKPAPVQSAPPPKPAPVQSAPPAPKPAPVQSAPPTKAAPPPPAKPTPPPPAAKPVSHAPPPPPEPAPVEESWDQGGYDQGGYDQGGYDQGGYDQGGYDQGGYDQGGYDQGGYDQGGYDQGGYDQGSYDQGGYDQGGYDQGYDQGGYDQGGYDQGGFLGQCRALYDYAGENETDLRFNAGDIISIVNDSDPSGWWEGDLNGARGYFPSNFVERL